MRFIQIQYSEKADEVALQYAIQVVALKLLQKKRIHMDQFEFDINNCESMPRIIQDLMSVRLKKENEERKNAIERIKSAFDFNNNDFKDDLIRRNNIIVKMIKPFSQLIPKSGCSRLEREEAILYDMLALPTILFIIFLWLNEVQFIINLL